MGAMDRILVFPAGLPEAAAFAATAQSFGRELVGASSVSADPAKGDYRHWVRLPYVYEDGFASELGHVLTQFGISSVFTSHEVVRQCLARLLPELAPAVTLLDRPVQPRQSGPSHAELQWLAAGLGVAGSAVIGPVELDAVLQRALAMRSESSLVKLAYILALAPLLPPGDVVEIGALAGRSAFVLGWAARRYGVGPVLVMDPWSQSEAMQHDAPQVLLDSTKALDFGGFFAEFLANLVPCFHGSLNYLRSGSGVVRPSYRPGFRVGPTEFGSTEYLGRIALLHIDGNHDLTAVARDVADWLPLLCSGGWAVLDDYDWPFGDGPRRVGDALLQSEQWQTAFVCAGALFLRRG